MDDKHLKKINDYVKAMDEYVRGQDSGESQSQNLTGGANTSGKISDLLEDIISKFSLAITSPE